MPKIVFWNIQRLKGGQHYIGGDELKADLEGIGAQVDPDIIVLCEGLKGLRRTMRDEYIVPSGYTAPKFNKAHGDYLDQNTLRYVLLTRVVCTGYLLGTGNDRPALAITFTAGGAQHCIIALHAPQGGGSTVPGSTQMKTAYTACINAHLAQPAMIVGDLNIDASLQNRRQALQGHLNGHALQPYRPLYPPNHTHRNQNTGIYDTTLDWALVRANVNANVSTVEMTADVDMNDGSDDEFLPSFDNHKEPDHKPILVTW